MADIFLSYDSADRPRAETLRSWFEQLGWSVWSDRNIELGDAWENRVTSELQTARLVVVLWSSYSMQSEWVQKEAGVALNDGRLLQIHGTGIPLLPPFDAIQALRMQSWSGEQAHSERERLLATVAQRLGVDPSITSKLDRLGAAASSNTLPPLHEDLVSAIGLAFHYCTAQIVLYRAIRAGTWVETDIRETFSALLTLIHVDRTLTTNDPDGVLHRMVEDFLNELNRPASGVQQS